MPELDDEAAEAEERWCYEQQRKVADYLRSQGLNHGRIGEWPAWLIDPFVSIWAIESLDWPGWIGWWAISGDLPTDYISSADVQPPQHPRKAIRIFGENWLAAVKAWNEGREIDNLRIGDPTSHEKLGPLLEARAVLLIEWANDDSLWEEM